MQNRIFFRADGNARMGLGHIVRTTALCEMLKADFQCILLTRCSIPGVLELAKNACHEVIALQDDRDYGEEARYLSGILSEKDIVVLDGYDFGTSYQQFIKNSGAILTCIDDIHAYTFLADCIINHSGGIIKDFYDAPSYCQFFLGPSFSLIRRPFLEAAKKPVNSILKNRHCLICLGGADPDNQTLAVLEQLVEKAIFDKYEIIIGGGYVYRDMLIEEIKKNNYPASIHHSISPESMVDVMQRCTFAVCSPSTVAYEYMSVGGVLFLHQIADNQSDVIRFMTSTQLAFHFKEIGKHSESEYLQAMEKQAACFDGFSSERFRKLFQALLLLTKIKVRRATSGDIALTFEWANDKLVREQSYNNDPITIEMHTAWFLNKMQQADVYYYILEEEGLPVAQIRFEIKDNKALLGYLVAPGARNKGLGPVVLAIGIKTLKREAANCNAIIGFVKNTNIASQKAFERFSFTKTEATEYPDSLKYTLFYGNNN